MTPDAPLMTGLYQFKAYKVLHAMRDAASTRRQQLETAKRRPAADIMRAAAGRFDQSVAYTKLRLNGVEKYGLI